jgi:hypothetical protein
MLASCESYNDVDWSHAPPFKLIHTQPHIKLPRKQQPLKTHAFYVQVLTADAPKMNQFLRKIYEDDHLFMPYSMKKKFPQAVAKAIAKQNQLIKDTWVVVLVGITREMMSTLEGIIETHGIVGISETNRTDRSGRWHVLVTEGAFKRIRKLLNSKLQSWINDLPDDMIENIPPEFPEPKVYQKHNYEGDDDSSSGQASYMWSCAQSYGSFDDMTMDELFNPPGRSYASALVGNNYQPAPAITAHIREVLIPKATPREAQANATIVSLQAEIKNLRTLLLGAQLPSTVTKMSGPKTGETSDRMTTIESNMEQMTLEISSPVPLQDQRILRS